ncbi:MAG: SDR family oxidoreductase [Alphaproteobacteria bacterium]|jgi:3alpha(or 20beta)-hydroxysteroid dehydrogenase|uniref:3alpha(Or 20beta)-hydroxysteroid dehydrogenase n=1 Tax=Celeribacter baekdonensis TaxID=875171 RepID=A0A1G7R7N8_9RHOB|nr:SDR family NAD(P)-dependent oxidoreductase [Celeribacter baekdonensis]MBU0643229.1 SDR family oxidoreductase [Alphaproteobacteria bacterium]MBU1281293.1 SDR family oxidoreductase [Alphaproteobacteria bacterium]MBU1571668.1 SDR family oxidoreductase [Alphaproteobacteria bacterium]MBU1828746.1 SDR family oxidoreductase [Alphaproteobacteria bacterium]MBU2076427.1 SDR family oxidoreductase [Alphaproteobacteria bacterium]
MSINFEKVKNALTDLSGKTAIVTGAARGQGAIEAELLATAGASVLLCDVLEEDGVALAARLVDAGHNVRFVALDVTSEAAWCAALDLVRDWTGRLDILVNNAGIINRKIIRDMSVDEWRKVMDVNATGAFIGLKHAAPFMAETGGGSIINISSNSGFSGHYDPAYTSSKWALRGLTRTAAMEFADMGIRVNAICPGLIVTDLNRSSPHLAPMINLTPMQRSGEADEVAQLVLFLASEGSAFITGEDFVIDGGFTAGAAYRRVAKETGLL